MKCQSLFSGKNKKNIINLSSAELAQRVVNVNMNDYCYVYPIDLIKVLFRMLLPFMQWKIEPYK